MRRGGREFEFWWRVGLATVAPLFRLLVRLRFVDLDRIPESGPAILAANHVSALDPIAIALATSARGRPVRFLAAAEFFAHPVWGWGLRRTRHIPVRRGTRDLGALRQLQDVLHRGGLAGIFPEGRVGNGELPLKGRSGLARAALAARVPVLPVGVWGTQARWPLGGPRLSRPLRVPVAIVLGDPFHLPASAEGSPADLKEATHQIMRRVEAQVLRARALLGASRALES
jgi:1-acyl-sn-glycerol-3-phosphate acyltransferase